MHVNNIIGTVDFMVSEIISLIHKCDVLKIEIAPHVDILKMVNNDQGGVRSEGNYKTNIFKLKKSYLFDSVYA